MAKLINFIRENKGIAATIAVIIIFPLVVLGISRVYTPSDNAIKEGQKVENTQVKEVEQVVKEDSKSIDFVLPMAEDVIAKLTEQERMDGTLSRETKLEVIQNTYGDKVYNLLELGILPSKLLTKTQNKVILDTVNSIEGVKTEVVRPAWEIKMKDYVLSHGVESIQTIPYSENLEYGYAVHTNDNVDTWVEVDGLLVGGVNVYPVEENTYMDGLPIEDNKYFSDMEVSELKDVTVLSYFVTTTEGNSLKGSKLFDKLNNIDFSINGKDVKKLNESLEQLGLWSYTVYGDSLFLKDNEDDIPESSFYQVIRYVNTNVLEEHSNQVSINGNPFNLSPSNGKLIRFNEAK